MKQDKLGYLYILCLSGCLFVCLYPKNVKMAELIGSKFCVLLLYDVYKEKMFRIEKEDGCEAP